MQQLFQKEISFLSRQAISGADNNTIEWQDVIVNKVAHFKELKRTDRDQHKLHFKIISLFEMLNVQADEETGKVNISSDALYDLTVKCIKTLLVIDDQFTEADRNDFLSDSGAILQFSMWMLKEKLMPFFSLFKMS